MTNIKLFLLIFALTLSSFAFCQQKKNLFLRGKVLGAPIIEDNWILNGTLGIEYEFIKNHSFGIDYIYFQEWKEYDTPDDQNTGIYGTEQSLTYLGDYRFYFQPFKSKSEFDRFYLSLYYKHTSRKLKNDADLEYSDNTRISGNYKFDDIGTALGYHFSFNPNNDKIGIDFNIGISRRFKNENYLLYVNENLIENIENKKSSEWKPSIRLNFYFKLF
ncbi:hypothetical protein [Flavobacterium celericrescens]|uniref:Outer membrane protein beta-barrel domain-containing protein n=1 Tax=Flavobacterium celericrescens TaxID=2709780 RepID=A0ABX0IDS3_9FLAO|nr:hypothetical protein [Flavobacterium celericrescens]NHM05212.1 hypothetical protein [Flavobacterium celericrescens]